MLPTTPRNGPATPIDNARPGWRHCSTTPDTQANIRGTAWAGYQAVVEYLDHYAPVRDTRHAATARATRLLTSDEPAKTKRAAWSALLHG